MFIIFTLMKLIKTYKYKLRPNPTQKVTFESWLGINRYLYNNALEHRITAYQSAKVSVSRFDQYNQLVVAKKEAELSFLKQVHSEVLQETLDRVDKAFKSFYNGAGFPKFQGKRFYSSFTFKRSVEIKGNKIKLPKIGWVRFFNSRIFEGKIKYTTVVKELDDWYVCVCVEQNPIIRIDSQDVGIDMGVARLATLSDGTFYENPKFVKQYAKEMRILQRKLARQVKDSKSREKTKRKITKLYQKIRRCRLDYTHKMTTEITSKYNVIYVEHLNLKGMTKSSKGNAEQHGKMVKQKSGLNRVLLDTCIGITFNQLEYKTKFQSGTFLKVNPAYTSQKCSCCGHTSKNNRQSQELFLCEVCFFKANADDNASQNIISSGRTESRKRGALARALA